MEFADFIARMGYEIKPHSTSIIEQFTKPRTVKNNEMIKIPRASQLRENHAMNKEKLFEVYGVIEQLVKDDKGERIVGLCRYMDKIVEDYNNGMVLTHKPLIDLFKLLINEGLKGEKLLHIIRDVCNEDLQMFINSVRYNVKQYNLSPEEIKERADESLKRCLDVI